MSVYMESPCFIDVAKYTLGQRDSIDDLAGKEAHIQACIRMLEAAKKGQLEIFTANLTNSECQHMKGLVTEDMKRLFRSILTSGRVVRIVTDSIFISERAQELRWDHDICLSGADAHHLATALEAGCNEFITYDNAFHRNAEKIETLGIQVRKAHESRFLPVEQPEEDVQVQAGGGLFDFMNEGLDAAEESLEDDLPPE